MLHRSLTGIITRQAYPDIAMNVMVVFGRVQFAALIAYFGLE
jgi:hypothetical protein